MAMCVVLWSDIKRCFFLAAGHSKPSSSHGTNWGTIKPGMFSTGSGSSKAMEAWNDLVEMKRQLQDKEFEAVRQAMVEERSRFCLFVSCLKPFLVRQCRPSFCVLFFTKQSIDSTLLTNNDYFLDGSLNVFGVSGVL